MPTYQYACTECGNAFEAVQSFSDDALTECPACSGRLRKVFSSVGIVFKGSGFYRNDSREAAKSSSTASEKNGTDKGDKGEKGDKGAATKDKAAATAGSGSTTSDSPTKSLPAKAASTSSKPTSSGSTSSSTAGSAA